MPDSGLYRRQDDDGPPMIEYQQKDITTVRHGIIAHGVNCQRKMASGVAGAIKKKWPAVYEAFMELKPVLGEVDLIDVSLDLWVANCYTQRNYGKDGKRYANLKAIENCLLIVAKHAYALQEAIYMPKIGCGLGGLDWEADVKPILETLDTSYSPYDDVHFVVCEI